MLQKVSEILILARKLSIMIFTDFLGAICGWEAIFYVFVIVESRAFRIAV